jgi:hypothetical protein
MRPRGGFRRFRRKAFKVVLTHTLDDEKPAILRATIYSLVRVLSIDSKAFADAKDATIVRCARLHGQFALEYEKLVDDFAVEMPRDNFTRGEGEETHAKIIPRRHGLRTLYRVIRPLRLLIRGHGPASSVLGLRCSGPFLTPRVAPIYTTHRR